MSELTPLSSQFEPSQDEEKAINRPWTHEVRNKLMLKI